MKKAKVLNICGLSAIIAVIIGRVYYEYNHPTLPLCRDTDQVESKIAELFIRKTLSAGGEMKDISVANRVDEYDKRLDTRTCSSQVTADVVQNNERKRLVYLADFTVKWTNKEEGNYRVQLQQLTHLPEEENRANRDIEDLTGPLVVSPAKASPVADGVLFYAPLKEGDGSVSLSADKDNNVVLTLTVNGEINEQFVVDTLKVNRDNIALQHDGVDYLISFNETDAPIFQVQDTTGRYQIKLNASVKDYINNITK